ncbi:PKD domain-containing protein [Brachybacterium fresconis]
MRRVFGLLVSLTLLGGGMTVAFALSFNTMADAADQPSPPPLLQRTEDVVTADPLPTVQIDNGYVWAQETIGSTVYAVGDFDNARAPLADPGTQLTPRSNVLAYDINTGDLLPFAPQVNGVIKAVAASPDGSRVYIGGSFTSVNGQTRYGIAALDATTGQLVPGFQPAIGGSGVYALVAEGSMVYAGGLFTQANGVPRQNAAAFNASNGALMPWAPQTDRQVDAMVADPGGEKIILGGRFSQVNGDTSMRGAAAIDELTGAVDGEWALTQTVKNGLGSGNNRGKAGIFALATDDDAVYGTGWVFANLATGNLEGTFAAEADTGEVRWIADCLGDHYGVYSTGETVYTTSHTHACSTMGLHPEQSPRDYRYVEAYTTDARGLLGHNPHAGGTYQDWFGTPGPSAYAWYPDFYVGTTSGLGQAGLSITGVGDTISIAGEFVGVNNQRFEGIVRFSTNPPQGAKEGPRISGSDWKPTANSFVPGRVRVAVPGNWDRDDLNLTYELHRSGTSEPVDTVTEPSTWWDHPGVVLEDTAATAGSSATYTVVVRDGDGNSVTSEPVSTTVAAGVASEYVTAVIDDSPQLYYPLGDTMQDWAGANPPEAGNGVTAADPGIENSSTGYSDLNGSSSGRVASSSTTPAPEEFSTELWFRTTSSQGGKLIGYGSSASGDSSSYDRHVYMNDSGQIVFGVYPGSAKTIQSVPGYNDGQWHHVVASQSADGMELFLDGSLVAGDPSVTTAQNYTGYWRIGGDNLNGWPNSPSSNYFDGAIDEVAVYGHALDSSQVATHYGIGKGFGAPTSSFAATSEGLDVAVDAEGSSAAGGATLEEYRWDFGDGSPEVTGETATHTYDTTGTFTVTLTVVDSNGLSATSTRTVDVTGPNAAPSAEIETSLSGLTVTADGSGSSDPDGQIASYEWDWGDGESSTGQVASHPYAAAGAYTVTLTVTDDQGGTAQTTAPVTVTHAEPTAVFTSTTSGLAVDVDAGGSVASDDASLSYSWDWGDGTATSDGRSTSHSYVASGDYEITLTVTDSLGATDMTTQSVSVTSEVFAASDSFERTVASGWGSADVGGEWTSTGWGTAAISVGDGAGTVSLAPGVGRNMVLSDLSLANSGSEMTYTLDGGPSTGSSYIGLTSRYGDDGEYRSLVWHRADGSMWLLVQRGGELLEALPVSEQWAAGDAFHLRTEVEGGPSATIRVKVWPQGASEPVGWQLETTDSSAEALTGSGASSVYLYRSGSATGAAPIHIDDYRVQSSASTEEPAENLDPVAAFTSSISGLAVSVDRSSSTDDDGTVMSYEWDYGDGTADTGETSSHEYGDAGTYEVTLTVTDDDGATHTTTRSVSVTSEVFAASDSFERTVPSGWGSADVGGAWTSTGWGSAAISVGDGVGTMALTPGVGRNMVLDETALTDSASEMTYTLDGGPSTGSLYIGLASRYGAGEYRSLAWHRADGSMWLLIQRNGEVIEALSMSGQWTGGDSFHLRTEVVGESSPTIRVKAWPQGASEPVGWQLEITDTNPQALTTPGASSVYLYRSGSASGAAPVHIDEYHLSDLAGTAAAAQRMAIAPEDETPTAQEKTGASATEDTEKTGAVESPETEKAPEPPTEKKDAPAPSKDSAAQEDLDQEKNAGAASETAPEASDPEPTDPGSAEALDGASDDTPEPKPTDGDPATTGEESASDQEDSVPAPEDSKSEEEPTADAQQAPEEAPADDSNEAEDATPVEDPEPATDSRIEDKFDRTAESGWGEANHGGTWSLADDSEATLNVADGVGRLELAPGSTADVLLDGTPVAAATAELTFRVEEVNATGGTEVGILLGQDGDSPYRAAASMRPDGSIWLTVFQGEEQVLEQQIEDMTYETGTTYTLAVSGDGEDGTALAVKLWETGNDEPADWQLTATADDIASPMESGQVGLTAARGDEAGGKATVAVEEFTMAPQD